MIWTDHPDYFADNAGRAYVMEQGTMLKWLLDCMTVSPDDVAIDYTLRCYPKAGLPSGKAGRALLIEECNVYRFATIAKVKPKVLVGFGQVTLEAFTGRTRIGEHVEQRIRCWEPVVRDYAEHIWMAYNLNYILGYPSDTQNNFRVLFMAAKEAGLNPKVNPTVPPFRWTKKK